MSPMRDDEGMQEAIVVGLLVAIVAIILLFARGAAKRGEKYIDSEDPIERMWLGTNRGISGGWRWRVRAQSRLDEDRTKERRGKLRRRESAGKGRGRSTT